LYFSQCNAPNFANDTAEAIQEIQGPALAKFGTIKFQGVGIT
jgi:hypothetical protein